jgi:hypothetical protein
MEDGLWLYQTYTIAIRLLYDCYSLNPCFSGRWSLTARECIRLYISILSVHFGAKLVFRAKKVYLFRCKYKEKMSKNDVK